tara:strand:- start:28 stop:513 length:486 start_codon:yes stop_codon:yes gene_type:complete
VGFGRLPEGEELIAQSHHMGIGNVLEAQIECIGQCTTWLLSAENAPIEKATSLLFLLPAFGAHEAVAAVGFAGTKLDRGDHAVAIKGVMHGMTIPFKPTRPVAVKTAIEFNRDTPAGHLHPLPRELLLNVAEGAGPVSPIETGGGRSNSHNGTSIKAFILS